MWRYLLFLAAVPSFVTCVTVVHVGPKYPPTKGEVWPKPFQQDKTETYYVIESPIAFNIKTPNCTCDILDKAVHRLLHFGLAIKFSYLKKQDSRESSNNDVLYAGTFTPNRTEFRIELYGLCEKYPHLEMSEHYHLTVGENIVLRSGTIWGILRGLQTFSHLLYFSDDYSQIRVNATRIVDYPAYSHRGLLVDTGRHYLSPHELKSLIDAMEMNKLNVLHWHIVDDQSFPYQSEKFPDLSKKGAYHSSMVYTKDDIQKLVEHGRFAGIRVIPEFDVPGHVRSWGEAYPELLTKCYENKTLVGLGPLDPTKNETYTFLQQLYQEVSALFPDEYMHLGGDEVDVSCWESNPRIKDYLNKHRMTSRQLYSLFMQKVNSQLPAKNKAIIWQDVFVHCTQLPEETTLVQMWEQGWTDTMVLVLGTGRKVVFSSTWYIKEKGWENHYMADPRTLVYSLTQVDTYLHNIVGGEACMWGEMVDDNNAGSSIWPHASAVAERLWTGMAYMNPPDELVTDEVRRRIEEHTCRMIERGIAAKPPNGPGFCVGPRHSKSTVPQ